MGRADLHLHTHFSDGLDTPQALVVEAARRGLSVIAVTDHDILEGALRASSYARIRHDLGVEVVVGEEISTLNGHVIGLYLRDLVPPRLTARRTVELIHAQGGLAVLAHPFHAYTGRFKEHPRAARLLKEVPFDAVETVNHDNILSFLSRPAAERLASEYGLARVGVSDAHNKDFIGMGFTGFQGKSAEDLRQAILGRRTRADIGRTWGVKDVLRHLKDSTKVVWRYGRLRSAA